jgi:hypothetical protein
MSNKIAIFWHAIFSGGSRPIDTGYACGIMSDQMKSIRDSGLLAAAEEMTIGVNGGQEDVAIARLFAPPNAKIVPHGIGTTTEIPTMNLIRQWLPKHKDWKVLYGHFKGVSHPFLPSDMAWRERMEQACVWGWRNCVQELENGTDACGCHWLTPEKCPGQVAGPFFGGTFWWSTAKYLLTLPPLPAATWDNRYEAERWIGRGPRRPKVLDLYPGWPDLSMNNQ